MFIAEPSRSLLLLRALLCIFISAIAIICSLENALASDKHKVLHSGVLKFESQIRGFYDFPKAEFNTNAVYFNALNKEAAGYYELGGDSWTLGWGVLLYATVYTDTNGKSF